MTALRPRRNALVCKRLSIERLAIEQLEKRELFAGDVSAAMQGQMLVIVGDADANGIVLTYNSAAQSYRVTGTVQGSGQTTINGLDAATSAAGVEFSGVKQVYVGLGDGDDDFQVGSPTAVDTVIQKWLTIDMGEGDDNVVLGASGNAPSGAAPIAQSLTVGTSINVNLGAGNDHLSIANATAGFALNINAGDGDDHVDFDTEFTPSGAATPTIFPVVARGNASISLGGGADELTMKNVSIQGSLKILDGAGAADLTLANVNVKKRIDINTGSDADEISLQSVRAKQLAMNTNGGIDNVQISNSKFTTINLKLGAGRDHLAVDHTRSSFVSHIDGEAQGSQFVNTRNSLHRLWRRHLG
jgi:hypothetical protein